MQKIIKNAELHESMGSSKFNPIQDQDLVLIFYDKRRRWIRKVEKGQEFHCDRGYFKYDDIIEKVEFGTVIKIAPNGNKIQLLKPLPSDIVTKMGRESQIIYPEDIGLILMYTGIGPGSKVVEAGCGSGSLTSIMGYYVRPSGHIYSYDIRDVAVKQALKNVKRVLGADSEVVSIELKDLITEVHHQDIDVVMLDMATPWLAIPKAYEFLKKSGICCSFSPVVEQVIKTHAAMKQAGFMQIETYELLKRSIQVKDNATRPETRMVGHTGYISFGRKIDDPFRNEQKVQPKNEFVDMALKFDLKNENEEDNPSDETDEDEYQDE